MASIDQSPKPKPIPEETLEPTAMELAFKGAGVAKPEVVQTPTEEEASAPAQREPKKKRPFDPRNLTEGARKSYVQIGEELRAQGVEPSDLTPPVFAPANAKIDEIYKLADAYRVETDPKKKRSISIRMRRAKDALEGGVVEGVEEHVRTTEAARALFAAAAKSVEPPAVPVPEAQKPVKAIDKNEFAAPQYGKGSMQKEMDALSEIPPATQKLEVEEQEAIDERIAAAHIEEVPIVAESEPLPSVFHHNRREPVPKKEAAPETLEVQLEEAPSSKKSEQNIGRVRAKKMGPDNFEYVTFTPVPEGTPKELRQKLRELIMGTKGAEGKVEKKVGLGERLKGYLTNRSGALDAKAAEMGVTEKGFRWLGEQYDKLGWRPKLAVGLSLGVGMGVGAAISLPLALTCLAGATVQRSFGFSSAFLKYEKSVQDGKWKKEIAMTKAVGQAALMTGGMLLLAEGAKEATEWLRQYLSSAHAEAPVAEVQPPPAVMAEAPHAEAVAEVSQPVPVAGAGEAIMPHPAPETLADQEILKQLAEDEKMTEATRQALESQESPIPSDIPAAEAPMEDAMGAQEIGSVTETPIEVSPPPEIPAVDAHDTIASLSESPAPAEHMSTIETQAPAPVINKDFIMNSFDVRVPVAEPHLYADSVGNTLAFGGSHEEQMKFITDYLKAHTDSVVQGVDAESHRVPFTLVGDKVVAGPALRTSSFLGLFSGFAQVPGPEEFKNIIK